MSNIVKNFIKYVKIDTESDPYSNTQPSTMKQLDLSNLLLTQLKDLGLDAHLDKYGYVYTKLPSNLDYDVPKIGFLAHVDTSFDAPGKNVKPRIIEKYNGEVINLNQELSMSPKTSPALKKVIGDDIIVTDGNTLLGADNKAGVAIIMELVTTLVNNKDIKHGDIYICFTPDEEIGRGTIHFDHDYFKADFAYTLDGSEVGEIEYENFNAASALVEIIGKSIHPGDAKNQMINASLVGMEFHNMLPTFLNPAYTERYEGFNHLTNINGTTEKTTLEYIIRNHNKDLFNKQKQDFINIKNYLNNKYNYNIVNVTINDSYYNMYEVIKDNMHIIDIAKQAIRNVGLKPITNPIRGGTDGARLTFENLPCPNLGTGGFNYHGRMEFLSINQMKKSLKIALEIIDIVSKNKLA